MKNLEVGDFFCIGATTRGQFGRTCPETYEEKIVALLDRETNLLFLVSLMKLHRGMSPYLQSSVGIIHCLWPEGGGRC